jgi:TetR/AcrR family transcriptional repressor of mexJK operon
MTTGPEVRVAAVVDADEDPAGGPGSDEESRSARKRRAITEAATTLFLRNGYQGTSMDEVAALAAVSKQTVYKNFADKEQLFSDIVLGITGNADRFAQVATTLLQDTDDLEKDLRELARRYLTSVLQPQVLQLRRLVIGEAARFPELGRAYYARAPERVLATLASLLQDLADRGLLRLDDPLLAARHLAFLILSIPLDKAMFCGDEESFTAAELERFADAGVGVFLAAYGAPLKAIS